MPLVHGRRIIAVSLYGDEPRYLIPALQLPIDAKLYYPDWEVVYFVDRSVTPNVLSELKSRGVLLRFMDDSGESNGMFWRFRAVGEPGAERVIFRDADSLLTEREAEAVEQWISTGKALHILRDHPFHHYKVLAGMFGVKVSETTRTLATLRSESNAYAEDINALVEKLLPNIPASEMHVNDSLFDFNDNPTPFPSRTLLSYVGEVAIQPKVKKFWLRAVRAIALLQKSILGRRVPR